MAVGSVTPEAAHVVSVAAHALEHMAPHVPHNRCATPRPRLVPGMCFTIEPMVCLGAAQVRVLPDGWTVVTADGALSKQAEHTILVTEEGVEVLTRTPEG